MAYFSSMPWDDLIAVGIRTTADGPFAEDVFWQFSLRDRFLEIPSQVVDRAAFAELGEHLRGLDYAKVTRAMTSTRERIFRIWHREESRYRPERDELAARFRALVEKLGGNPEAAPAVSERVLSAWSAETRHYHDVEHLVDCLRELDWAGPVEELALWYHDVVYEPGKPDCEERSALTLLADAKELAIPDAVAVTAAELVRATAHVQGRAARTPEAELVLDIDLSILGRDPLRFMDYEYGVEEEYAAIPTPAFRRGRGAFLAGMLERPQLFLTEPLRRRFEEPARRNIKALLESPRYTDYR